jgi:hypothetical protein
MRRLVLAACVLLIGCATARDRASNRITTARSQLTEEWVFVPADDGSYQLGTYRVAGIGPHDYRGGPGYAFTLVDSSSTAWSINGTGRMIARGGRIAIEEEAELTDPTRAQWKLEARSSGNFRVEGVLSGSDRWMIETISSGAEPSGAEYGAEAVSFVRGDRVDAVVEFASDESVRVRVRPGLDAPAERVLLSAAAAVTLRRNNLRRSGTAIGDTAQGFDVSDAHLIFRPLPPSGHEKDKNY